MWIDGVILCGCSFGFLCVSISPLFFSRALCFPVTMSIWYIFSCMLFEPITCAKHGPSELGEKKGHGTRYELQAVALSPES